MDIERGFPLLEILKLRVYSSNSSESSGQMMEEVVLFLWLEI